MSALLPAAGGALLMWGYLILQELADPDARTRYLLPFRRLGMDLSESAIESHFRTRRTAAWLAIAAGAAALLSAFLRP